MDCNDEDVIIACGTFLVIEEEKRKKRRYWVHNLWKAREEEGEFHTIFSRLKDDQEKFIKYFRMSIPKFLNLLEILGTDIQRHNSKWRRTVSPEERLAVTLRYLATGDSQISLSFSYRLAPSTVNSIIFATLETIWRKMAKQEMPHPNSEMWEKIAKDFYLLWQFPNCIGAIDGKHVQIQAPKGSGSLYFNYKKTFSVVLLAVVDANYKFVTVDIGGYGKSSDGGIFAKSVLCKHIENNTLNIPAPRPLPNCANTYPFVIVGDEAFPLKVNLLRPYPRNTSRDNEKQKVFNYRLSRARRVVENAFGIMTQKFRIFYGRLQVSPGNADKVIQAACVLHNYLRDEVVENEPEHQVESRESQVLCLDSLRHMGGYYSEESMSVRDRFSHYFNTIGALPWQLQVIRRGMENDQ